MHYRIRAGFPNDLEAMYQLDVRCFGEHFRFSREIMLHYSHGKDAYTLIAETQTGEVAGFCIFSLQREARLGYLVTLDVAPEHRRFGIAKQLMTSVETQASAASAIAVELHVYTGNKPAISLYESLGYSMMGRLTDFYAPALHAFEMRKGL